MSNSGKSKNDRLADWREAIARNLDPALGEDAVDLDKLARDSVSHFAAEPDNPLMKAAEYFGLDISKRSHRDFLLHILAEVCFRWKEGRPSGTRDWTVFRYALLGQHLAIVTENDKNLSDAKAAERIKAKFSEDYGHIQEDTIRKRLPEARSWYSRHKAGK